MWDLNSTYSSDIVKKVNKGILCVYVVTVHPVLNILYRLNLDNELDTHT